jgi:hypothetical protein
MRRPSLISATLGALIGASTLLVAMSFASSRRATTDVEGAIPDSAQLATLRQRLSSERQIRLLGSFGTLDISRPTLDSAGVRSGYLEERARQRQALFVTRDAPKPPIPPPIKWQEISEIQTGHSMTGRGAFVGLLLGAALGATAAAMSDPSGSEGDAGYRAIGFFSGGVLLGTFAGTVIGMGSGWRTVYRASTREMP